MQIITEWNERVPEHKTAETKLRLMFTSKHIRMVNRVEVEGYSSANVSRDWNFLTCNSFCSYFSVGLGDGCDC
jgi:hypothetical protein